jgi:NAD(P)H-flavin reductase
VSEPAEPGVPRPARFLARADLGRLLDVLHDERRQVIGPTVADGAIVYDEVRSVDDLPAGWGAEQAPCRYRLERRYDARLFDFAVGPTSWKRYTFPPRVPVTAGVRVDGTVSFTAAEADRPRLAFLGVRACEIAALRIQDRVFGAGPLGDADYLARRDDAIIIAVECATSASTCFCTSMSTGPEVRAGYDLALSELDEGFVVRVGTRAGDRIAARLPLVEAAPGQMERSAGQVAAVRAGMGDPVAAEGLPGRLLAALDSPRWAEVAERCLACTNCTLVCPTCFCTSVTQRSDLDGTQATAERAWDSCFTVGFAKVAGGNFRPRVRDRYRQWLTHKFATWWDQFGTSGCVGCGRCVTWCPVGIDVREELAAIAPPLRIVEGPPPPRPAESEFPVLMPAFTPIELGPAPVRIPLAVAAPLALRATKDARAEAVEPAPPYVIARVRSVDPETIDVVSLRLETHDPELLSGRPGQFVMAALPAFSSVPISVSRFHPDGLELTMRAAGPATTALTRLTPGEEVGLRGPLGVGWPLEAGYGRDIVLVTGGIGLAPLRPLIDALLAERDRFRSIRIYYGARTPRDRLFVGELEALAGRRDLDVAMIVDRAGPEWLGRVGVVTTLFDQARWPGAHAVAYVCGPERMMNATAATLADRGLTPERIFVTLERHMECGVGLCGHCQMGRFFVCRDGPVFSLANLAGTFGREGI